MTRAGPAATPFNMAAYCLSAAARAHPAKPALIVIADAASAKPAEVWSYADLEDAVGRLPTDQ